MYRLVALDVDGTLLDSQHQLRPATVAAVQRVLAQGVHVCVATGKLFVSAQAHIRELGLVGPQITCNGAAIINSPDGALLAHEPLTPAALALALDALASHAPNIAVAWYTTDTIYTNAAPGWLDTVLARYHEPPLRHVAQLDSTLPAPVKLLVAGEDAALDALRAAVAPQLAGKVQTIRTTVDFLEFLNLDVDKGSALRRVMALLGIPAAEVVAIGDGENDISMLESAGLGVAMGNAIPALVAKADWLTTTHDEGGVAHALDIIFSELSRRG